MPVDSVYRRVTLHHNLIYETTKDTGITLRKPLTGEIVRTYPHNLGRLTIIRIDKDGILVLTEEGFLYLVNSDGTFTKKNRQQFPGNVYLYTKNYIINYDQDSVFDLEGTRVFEGKIKDYSQKHNYIMYDNAIKQCKSLYDLDRKKDVMHLPFNSHVFIQDNYLKILHQENDPDNCCYFFDFIAYLKSLQNCSLETLVQLMSS